MASALLEGDKSLGEKVEMVFNAARAIIAEAPGMGIGFEDMYICT